MHRHGALTLTTLLAALLAGCRAAPPGPATLPEPVGEWPAAAGLLGGTELGEISGKWHAGDRLLLGLRSQRDGRVTVRYLLVELLEGIDGQASFSVSGTGTDGKKVAYQVAPPSRLTRLTVFDQDGKRLVQSRGSVPDKLLNNGLFGMLPAEGTSEPDLASERGFLALISLVSFSSSSGGNSALSSMTRQVISMPSLWSMITRRPVLGIKTTGVRPGAARLGAATHPAAIIDVDVSLNDELAFLVEVTAIRSVAPIGLVSGVIQARGRHPADPSRQLTLQTLAARRGTGSTFRAYTVPATSPAP